MAGIFGSVAGSSAASSKSSADFLNQQTITSDDAAPEDRIATMMREMLDIPEYDNDVESFKVIQKKGGKRTWQSFGRQEGLLLQLTDPSKNPDKKLLKVDLLTIRHGDVTKQMKRLKDESNILISEIIGNFLKLSLFYDEEMKKIELSIDNIQEIQQRIDMYVEMMPNKSSKWHLKISENIKHLQILRDNSVIKSSWWMDNYFEPINLNEKIEFYSRMVNIGQGQGLSHSRETTKDVCRDSSFLAEIAMQQKKSIYEMFKSLTKKDGILSINLQEISPLTSIESMNIEFLSTDRLFNIDEVKLVELVKRIDNIGDEMAILSKQNERSLNQIGLSVQKENVVLKVAVVDENSEDGPKDGKILKQIAIKKSIDDMAKILAGHYSDFGNYKLLTNDCRHYVQRVLEELELQQLSPGKTLLRKASILISSFRTGRAQAHHLKTLSDQLGMEKEYERIELKTGEFSNIGQKAEQLIMTWFESKGRKIATINTLLTALKHDQVGLTAVAEEIEDSCVYAAPESVCHISNQLRQETDNIQQPRSPIIVQNIFNIQGDMVLNIQNLSIQLGIKPKDIPTFLKMLPPLEDEAEYVQKLIRLKHNEKFRLLPIHTMTRSTCLLHYNGPNGRQWHGSGFLVSLANFSGLILLSAGHNIEDGDTLLQDFNNFSFLFNNISGIKSTTVASGAPANNDIIPFTLQNLLNDYDCTLAIACKGMQLIKKGNGDPQQTTLHGNDAKLDYFALVFHASDIQDTMKKHGLEFLHCASASQLPPKKGDPVLIFGHPGLDKCQCPSGTCSCTHPLRLSYGNETGSSKQRMDYDLDTVGGNSGSPITGRNYTVKGIHVLGGSRKGLLFDRKFCNSAQTLDPVLKDLGKHSIIPVITP